jgi:hypothetical protein
MTTNDYNLNWANKMASNQEKSQADLEWENRTLCSDESCIGVIGPDGRCKECGKPFAREPKADLSPASETDDSSYREDPVADEEYEDGFETVSDVEWENRTLCSDESCIGIIGPDGRCKECGKPYQQH